MLRALFLGLALAGAASTWYGVLAPARTPPAVITQLHDAIVKALAAGEFRERLAAQGFEPVGSSPREFAATIRAEMAKWAKVIRESRIHPE